MSRIEEWWLRWFGFVPDHPVFAIIAILAGFLLYFGLAFAGGRP